MMFDQGTGLRSSSFLESRADGNGSGRRCVNCAKHCRTVSYTLCGDIGSGSRFDPALGFDNYVRQLDSRVPEGRRRTRRALRRFVSAASSRCGMPRCGPSVSRRSILASSPAPGWVPNERQQAYVARPWRSVSARSSPPRRCGSGPKMRAAYDTWAERLAFSVRSMPRECIAAPMIPSRMAARVTLQQGIDFAPDCARFRRRRW